VTDARGILERRRLRRRVAFWRLLALALAVVAVGVAVGPDFARGPYVARHDVAGVIMGDAAREDMLRAIAEDDDVLALVLRIDSPGGTVAGSESLYLALREVAEAKPVVAVMGEVAASGGYIAALAADRILARGATITGSIGVVAEYPDVSELLDTLGVAFSRVASAPLKAEPSPLRTPSDEALEAQAAIVEDAYDWFLGLVAERRGLDGDALRSVGDGRVFSGRQAVENGLVDALGGEAEALDWLVEARGVDADAPVRDVAPEAEGLGLIDRVLGRDALAALKGWARSPRLMAVLR
jgi:protease-4